MSQLLDIQNVTVRFGGVTAVEDVSLSIGARELLGFIGPNGAGKTTLMRVITGMVRPDIGAVLFKGTDISTWPTYKRIRGGLALAQQIVQPLHGFTLVENVVLAAGAAKTGNPLTALLSNTRHDERAVAMELLERTGIAEAAGRHPGELPLGFLKRLEVSRALAHGAADEVMADPAVRRAYLGLEAAC